MVPLTNGSLQLNDAIGGSRPIAGLKRGQPRFNRPTAISNGCARTDSWRGGRMDIAIVGEEAPMRWRSAGFRGDPEGH
jgi:hypothetical protein